MLSWYAHQHLIPSQPRLTDTCNEQVPTSFPCSFCMFVPQKLSLYSNTEKPNFRTTLLHYLIIRYKLQVTNDYFLSMSFSLAVVCRTVCWWKMCSNYLSNIRTFKLWCKKKNYSWEDRQVWFNTTSRQTYSLFPCQGWASIHMGLRQARGTWSPVSKQDKSPLATSPRSCFWSYDLTYVCLFFLTFETKMLVECPR